MKKVILIFILLNLSIAYGEIVDLDELHTYDMLYENAEELVDKYPKILKLVKLGQTSDDRLVFVMILSDSVHNSLRLKEGYVDKMHYFFEGGIHARENPGPILLLKTIELYCEDYYDDNKVPDFNVKKILKSHVLHFIPITNPDGYDLATSGIESIGSESQKILSTLYDQRYDQYKSNVNGVDINRNFPGDYYDVSKEKWQDIWNKVHNNFRSYKPSSSFYPGPYAGSEIETQLLMDYSLKYDFRSYISYHSKGMVIYYNKWMLSQKHNQMTLRLANVISNYSQYDLIHNSKYEASSGYLTDYTAMRTLKPSITVESVWWKRTLPVNETVIKASFEELKYLPLYVVKQGEKEGYFKYKWYLEGKYVRDFEEYVYAKAMKDRFGGQVLIYEGTPKVYSDFDKNLVTRQEFIELIMTDSPSEKLSKPFYDCDNQDVLRARALGYISGYGNYFRPHDYITYEEVYVILAKVFYPDYKLTQDYSLTLKTKWVLESIKILFENEVLDLRGVSLGRITLYELKAFLETIKSGG